MASYNKVLLMGNMTRDPQLKYLPNQTAVAEFGLAVSRKFKMQSGEEREEVLFVDCTSFGKQGEVINQYFQKGKPIFVEGRLKYDTWEDKNGGGKRHKITVVVDRFEFIGGREGGGGGASAGGGHEQSGGGGYDEESRHSGPPQRGPQQQNRGPAPQRPPQQEAPFSEEQQFKDDDIPF